MIINSPDISGSLNVSGNAIITGSLTTTIINNGVGDFLTRNSNGLITRRTASEVLTDINAQPLLTNPITGSIAVGQVAFATGSGAISGDDGLLWDNTNKRLGVGTITIPSASIHTSGDVIINDVSVGRGPRNILTNIAIGNNNMINTAGNGGSDNIAIGRSSLLSLTDGTRNIAIGTLALASHNFGSNNVAIGFDALRNSFNVDNCIAIGSAALREVVNFTNTIGIGVNAGRYLSNGTTTNQASPSSIFIGVNTRSGASYNLSNQIVIGTSAISRGANTTTIGNTTTINTWLGGDLLLGSTDSTGERLQVSGSAKITTVTNGVGDFLTRDSNGLITRRTASEVLTDIGANSGTGSLNYLAKYTINGTSLGNSAIYEIGGNVGIGVNNTGGNKLYVLGNATFTNGLVNETGPASVSIIGSSSSSTSAILNLAQVWNGNLYPASIEAQASPGLGPASSDLIFNTSIFSGGVITTEKMRITAGGNIGIGVTTNIPSLLTVKGSSLYNGVITIDNSSTTGGGVLQIRQNGVVSGFISVAGSAIGNTNQNMGYGAEAGLGHWFFTNDNPTPRFIINSPGNVLINTSNDNGNRLQVNGNITANNIALTGTLLPAITTNSTWSSYQTIINPGILEVGRTYIISVKWDFSSTPDQPYYCYCSFLWQGVSTNSTNTDNEFTPICSTHTGGTGANISFRSIAALSSTSGIQARLNSFIIRTGTLSVKYILVE
jgi:hypothetical protein